MVNHPSPYPRGLRYVVDRVVSSKSQRGLDVRGRGRRTFAAAPAPSADADIPVLYNGLLSTTGCLIPNYQVITTCSKLEALSPRAPVILNVNPVGVRIVVLGARLNNNGSLPGVLIPASTRHFSSPAGSPPPASSPPAA